MKHMVHLGFIAIFSIFVYMPSSQAQSCKELLSSLAKSSSSDSISYESFKIIETNAGLHGGLRYTIERNGGWHDFLKELKEKGDFVIDLRFFPNVLGEDEAKFFGFEIIDDFHITVPNVAELNGAIDKFNKDLSLDDPRRLLIEYYEIPGVHNTVNEYVTRYRDHLQVPVAQAGKSFFHDMSAHSMQGFFADNRIIEAAQQRTAFVFDMMEEFKTLFRGTDNEEYAKKVSFKMKSKLAGLIDQVGAFSSLVLPLELRSYFAQIGIDHYQEAVEEGRMEDDLTPEHIQYIRNNAAVNNIAYGHFNLIVEKDLKAYLIKEFRRKVWSVFRGEEQGALRDELINRFAVFVSNYFEEREDLIESFIAVDDLIANTRLLSSRSRRSGSIYRASNYLRVAMSGLSPEDKELLSDYEKTLYSHPITRSYVERLLYLRRNLNNF